MNAHRFDPLSAVLGLIAAAAGALVISGAINPFNDADVGIWATVLALAIGIMMIPWGSRLGRTSDVGAADVDAPVADSARRDDDVL